MIKALFFDLDGTLLTSSGKMSEKTKSALRACRKKGIKVFTATARPPLLKGMLNLTDEEDALIQDGGVFYNGGCICYRGKKEYTLLSTDSVVKTFDVIHSYEDVNIAVQLENEKHFFRFSVPDRQYKGWGLTKEMIISSEEMRFNLTSVVRIFVISPWDKLPHVYEKLMKQAGSMINIQLLDRGAFKCIDIADKDINKKSAIDRLIESCDYKKDEVAVFGDDYNDLEMLGGFRHSVAMGNACREAKECAAQVTKSNDEEGIYYALHDLLNLV